MKKFSVLLFSIFIFFNLQSQKIRMIKTKDLIQISDSLGLDRLLSLASGDKICYLDASTAKILAAKIDLNNCNGNRVLFLIDFCQNIKGIQQEKIQNSFIQNRIQQVAKCNPNDRGEFLLIPESELFFLTINADKYRQKMLVNYYNAWLKKSDEFKERFMNWKTQDSVNYKYTKQVNSYLDCNENCYRILLALERIDSKFATEQKINAHGNMRRDSTQDASIKIPYPHRRLHVNRIAESAKLSKDYNSIGEINFESEPELKKIIAASKNWNCWIDIVFNKDVGFVTFGCNDLPRDWKVECEIELKDKNTLLFYGNYGWDDSRFLK